MRSLVSRVVSISFTFYYITSPTSSAGYFTDLSRSYLTDFTALRGRDQQPGYFYNFTDFINLGALASSTSSQRATSTTTSACSSSNLITIKVCSNCPCQFRRGSDAPRVLPWQTARVIDLFYTFTWPCAARLLARLARPSCMVAQLLSSIELTTYV